MKPDIIKQVVEAALPHTEGLVFDLYPNGKRHGHEWCVGSLAGEPGDSLKINITKGVWKDFASGEKGGGDIVSLWAAAKGCKMSQAAEEVAEAIGFSVPTAKMRRGSHPKASATAAATVNVAPAPADDWIPQIVTDYTEMDPMTLKASAIYEYYNKSGDYVGHILRFDGPDGKRFVPRVHCYDSSADVLTEEWRSRGLPTPRPLYNLHKLTDKPGAGVVVVEGEKCADALQALFPDVVVVTWAGGANATDKTDFEPLRGRTLLFWPDNDDAGKKAMAGLVARYGGKVVEIPDDKPKGWDCADAIAEGWGRSEFEKLWANATVHGAQEPDLTAQKPKEIPLTVLQDPKALFAEYGIKTNRQGQPQVNMAGIYHYLVKHATWAGKIWYDTFRNRIRTNYLGPEKDWTDTDTARALLWFQRVAELGPAEKSHVDAAVSLIAQDTPRNWLTDWLKSLVWDEKPRLENWLQFACGTVADEYHASVGKNFILSLVARAFEPGCKVDTMPVFEGAQGAGKSTMLAILGGEYFAESHEQIGTKDFNLSLEGRWLMEISELHGMRPAEVERVKAVLSTATDRFRSPYDRHFKESPRQVVFAGTTNRDDWHSDDTGGRRFWPVRCGPINIEWLCTNREQLFAEAVARFNAGEKWWDVPETEAAAQIHDRRAEDPWEDDMREYLARNSTVTISHILDTILEVEVDKRTAAMSRRVGSILRGYGWKRQTVRDGGRPVRAWVKPKV
ncbi:MAG: VapE domain-containing protein [Verrucomicrobiota bacterium]